MAQMIPSCRRSSWAVEDRSRHVHVVGMVTRLSDRLNNFLRIEMRESGRPNDKRTIGESSSYRGRIFHKRNGVTLFVDNLPNDMSPGWLVQLFKFDGRVMDAFVSRKRRRGRNNPFGFVRFSNEEEALKAVRNLHGTIVKGCKLEVTLAKYDRRGQTITTGRDNHVRSEPNRKPKVDKEYKAAMRDNRSYKEVVQ